MRWFEVTENQRQIKSMVPIIWRLFLEFKLTGKGFYADNKDVLRILVIFSLGSAWRNA